MEALAAPIRVSRVDSRYRPRAQFVPSNKEADVQAKVQEEEVRQRIGRDTMGKDHRFFHRRAAQAASQAVAVNVDVVATVDVNGNLVAQETIVSQAPPQPTIVAVAAAVSIAPIQSVAAQAAEAVPSAASALQVVSVPQFAASVLSLPSEPSTPPAASVPQVPSVPSVPTVALASVPSVPSVPPFPSQLAVPTVPAYPFSSGVAVAQDAASAGSALVSDFSTGPATSYMAPAPSSAPDSAIIPGTNSTISTSPASFLSGSSASSPQSRSAALSPSASHAPGASSRPLLSETPTGIPTETTMSNLILASGAAATTYYGGGGAPEPPAVPPTVTTAANADADADGTPAPLETPQVVGSVVGSLAGAALILAIILLLIRRHKRRRGGALQLTGDDHTDRDQPTRQAPTRSSIIPSAFLHRFSGMSRSTADTSTSGGERSFQRVSGRKLPSAFSEGLTSEQFVRGGTMSGSSFYQDDHGIYGGPGLGKHLEKDMGGTSTTRGSGQMNFRPSPARTPVIRHPDDVPPFSIDRSHLSPPQSPNPDFPTRGTLGRSLPSADGSRSSRFTENV